MEMVLDDISGASYGNRRTDGSSIIYGVAYGFCRNLVLPPVFSDDFMNLSEWFVYFFGMCSTVCAVICTWRWYLEATRVGEASNPGPL